MFREKLTKLDTRHEQENVVTIVIGLRKHSGWVCLYG